MPSAGVCHINVRLLLIFWIETHCDHLTNIYVETSIGNVLKSFWVIVLTFRMNHISRPASLNCLIIQRVVRKNTQLEMEKDCASLIKYRHCTRSSWCICVQNTKGKISVNKTTSCTVITSELNLVDSMFISRNISSMVCLIKQLFTVSYFNRFGNQKYD